MKEKEYIIHITSGRGPAECCWVVAKVLSKICMELKSKGFQSEVLKREKGIEAGTLFSATLKASGIGIKDFLNTWEGTIQWIGQSPYRKFHKRKNWFIGVNGTSVSTSNQFLEKDFTYQVFRSGGPGGQHVNKVSTAVRAIHEPTGVMAVATDTRSQVQNKKLATLRLKELLKKHESDMILEEQQNLWNNHNALIRGNPIRVFRGREFREV